MATMRDIVYRGLRKIQVVGIGDEPEADYAADGLDVLNSMMHGWKSRSADTSHTTLDMSDTFPLAAEYEDATAVLLADRLAGEFGVQPPNQMHVKDAWDAIRAAFMVLNEAAYDSGLENLPSQIGRGNSRMYFG